MSEGNVPKGRWSRLVKAAGIGARAGVDLLNRSTSDVAAKKTAEALGQLRGLAAKGGPNGKLCGRRGALRQERSL